MRMAERNAEFFCLSALRRCCGSAALTCETEPPPSVGAWSAGETRRGRAEPPASWISTCESGLDAGSRGAL